MKMSRSLYQSKRKKKRASCEYNSTEIKKNISKPTDEITRTDHIVNESGRSSGEFIESHGLVEMSEVEIEE